MNPQNALAVRKSEYPCSMAQVAEKRADGTLVVVVPPDDVADLGVGEFHSTSPICSPPRFRCKRPVQVSAALDHARSVAPWSIHPLSKSLFDQQSRQ